MYNELWNHFKYLIKSKNNNSDDYDKKYNKIKFNSDDDIPLEKTLEMHEIVKVVTSVFNDARKYYPLVFLGEFLHKLDEYI